MKHFNDNSTSTYVSTSNFLKDNSSMVKTTQYHHNE